MRRRECYKKDFTFTDLLKSCGHKENLSGVFTLHAHFLELGFLDTKPCTSTTLIQTYAKCGMLAEAQEVFKTILCPDMISWNALITGYAQIGQSQNVFYIFDQMQEEGIKPSPITFMAILNVCNHSGLVDKGQMYFEIMCTNYGITPMLEHYVCIIDLLSRVGCIDKAIVLIKYMPVIDNLVMLITILNGCRRSGNFEVGRMAFGDASQIDGKDCGVYVCMSNIYASCAVQEEAWSGVILGH